MEIKFFKSSLILLVSVLFLSVSCSTKERPIPKPPTYLELIFPERVYNSYTDECGYSYTKPGYFSVKNSASSSCNRNIDFEGLNGTLFISRIDMDTSLAAYVNYSIDKVDEHKVKATAIFDTTFIHQEKRVFGTFFELQGNVASPFQFYVTDSTDRFINGVVYFNTRPNYDSIKPVLDFVKEDLYRFINTLEWETK